MKWFPVFANFRRDGYDFDARCDNELANIRHKNIMDCFENDSDGGITEYTGLQLKKLAGFGKDGHKNFDGIVTDLQILLSYPPPAAGCGKQLRVNFPPLCSASNKNK